MQTQTNSTPSAIIVWNPTTEAEVRKLIASGASVPKAMMKAAPKGFVNGLRVTRREELRKNTAGLLGGFTDKGFQIVACTPIKTLASGAQQVTLRLATPKPTSALTMAEFAKACGTSVEEIAKAFQK